MPEFSPRAMIITAMILMIAGVILPFLMVVHAIPSTFFLNFLAYTSSTVGLILGTTGVAMYFREKRGPRN